MTAQPIVSARLSETPLASAPIRPEWILAGTPQARVAELARSADGASLTAMWDCTAGTFDWYFGGDETVHILEGEVEVAGGGVSRVLRPGDVALFRAGTWARWHVPRYVRKLAFCHDALPRPVSLWLRASRKAGRIRRRLAGAAEAPAGLAARGRRATAAPLSSRLLFLALRTAGFSFGLVL